MAAVAAISDQAGAVAVATGAAMADGTGREMEPGRASAKGSSPRVAVGAVRAATALIAEGAVAAAAIVIGKAGHRTAAASRAGGRRGSKLAVAMARAVAGGMVNSQAGAVVETGRTRRRHR